MKNEERFEVSFIKTDHCWIWQKARDKNGYGLFSWKFKFGRGGSKMRRASRVAYEIFIGPIPEGMLVCHRCDNPPCVNPEHFFLGTSRDNLFDASNKLRTVGERSACTKLTNTQVEEMRNLYATGLYYQIELAIKFRISPGNISRLLRFKQWKVDKNHQLISSDQIAEIVKPLNRWQRRTEVRLKRIKNGLSPRRPEAHYNRNLPWLRRDLTTGRFE